jgi:hypothetical protein
LGTAIEFDFYRVIKKISNFSKIVLIVAVVVSATPSFAKAGKRSSAAKIASRVTPNKIAITPITKNGETTEVVELGNLPAITLVEPHEGGLSQAQTEELSKVRVSLLRKILIGLGALKSNDPVLVTDDAVTVTNRASAPSEVDEIDQFQEAVNSSAWTGSSQEQLVRFRLQRDRAVALVKFAWDAVVISTKVSVAEFWRDRHDTDGAREFGFTIIIRGEFQIGMGNVAVMKNIARAIDIGFDFGAKEVVIRRSVRKESMGDGVALSTGPKAEFLPYRANLSDKEHDSEGRPITDKFHVEGLSLYPPAVPGVSVAAQKYPGYYSVGVLGSGNVFELYMPWIPLYLANTLNKFEADYTVTRVSIRPGNLMRLSVKAVKLWFAGKESQQKFLDDTLPESDKLENAGQCVSNF